MRRFHHPNNPSYLLLCSALIASGAIACGDAGPDSPRLLLSATVPTMIFSSEIGRVVYDLDCSGVSKGATEDVVTLGGSLEFQQTYALSTDRADLAFSTGLWAIWEATVDAPPGSCVLLLVAFDTGGERACVGQWQLTVAAETPTLWQEHLDCSLAN